MVRRHRGEHKPSLQKSTVLKPAEPANLQERKKLNQRRKADPGAKSI
jgi:hypothetical protein